MRVACGVAVTSVAASEQAWPGVAGEARGSVEREASQGQADGVRGNHARRMHTPASPTRPPPTAPAPSRDPRAGLIILRIHHILPVSPTAHHVGTQTDLVPLKGSHKGIDVHFHHHILSPSPLEQHPPSPPIIWLLPTPNPDHPARRQQHCSDRRHHPLPTRSHASHPSECSREAEPKLSGYLVRDAEPEGHGHEGTQVRADEHGVPASAAQRNGDGAEGADQVESQEGHQL